MPMPDDRYTPEPRQYEDKQWLYQQYWGELRTLTAIADECDVSHPTIARQMRAFGIPRRSDAAGRAATDTSLFAGFYNSGEYPPDRRRTTPGEAYDNPPTDTRRDYTEVEG